MKTLIGVILLAFGLIGLGVCGLGVTVSLVAWIASLLGIPFITGAGILFFKFAGTWLVSMVAAAIGYGLFAE